MGGTGTENEHIVPVRDIPKASTCISTGRGETVGNSSMSLPVDEDMLNSLGLCDRIDNLYIAGAFEDDFFLKAEAKGWSLVEVKRSGTQNGRHNAVRDWKSFSTLLVSSQRLKIEATPLPTNAVHQTSPLRYMHRNLQGSNAFSDG